MTAGEDNRKNSADFSAQRNEFFMRQSSNNKMIPPRVIPLTSAKAVADEETKSEVPEEPKVVVDNEATMKAVVEALHVVGEDVAAHLSESDKKFIKEVCLKEETNSMGMIALMLIPLGFASGFALSKYLNKKSD
jgi:hypothetical protein